MFTSCFNGGSCLPDQGKQTFSCSCLPSWTGDRCEARLGNNDMAVITHKWKAINFFSYQSLLVFTSFVRFFSTLTAKFAEKLFVKILKLKSYIKKTLTNGTKSNVKISFCATAKSCISNCLSFELKLILLTLCAGFPQQISLILRALIPRLKKEWTSKKLATVCLPSRFS